MKSAKCHNEYLVQRLFLSSVIIHKYDSDHSREGMRFGKYLSYLAIFSFVQKGTNCYQGDGRSGLVVEEED